MFILLLSFLISSSVSASPIIIGHRGASFYAPEGTKAAYILAIEQGVDYLEADIQRSKDGVLFIIHDENLKRTTDVVQKFPDRQEGSIRNFTSRELKALDAGSWFNRAFPYKAKAEYSNLKLLTLEEFLDIAGKKPIYLETKKPKLYPDIERDLYRVLKKRRRLDRKLILQTFEPSSLVLLNKYMPEIQKCFLLDFVDLTKVVWAKRNGAKYIGLPIGSYFPRSEIHRLGLGIHVYTVDDIIDMKRVEKEDGIFTNVPDIARKRFGEKRFNIKL